MFLEKVCNSTDARNSLLCVGLDPPQELVARLGFSTYAEFNREIVEATHSVVCAYKPQVAYYSALAKEQELEATISSIKLRYPDIPVILDAKRSDIGNTAIQYAKEVFDRFNADAVTVNPYMGLDTIEPFLAHSERGVIVLVKTSNPGANDFRN